MNIIKNRLRNGKNVPSDLLIRVGIEESEAERLSDGSDTVVGRQEIAELPQVDMDPTDVDVNS